MHQQTHQRQSIDTFVSENTLNDTPICIDDEQRNDFLLKPILRQNVHQIFKISSQNDDVIDDYTSSSKVKQMHRDYSKSINQFNTQLIENQSNQTERYCSFVQQIPDDLISFSNQSKVILNQIINCEKLTQIIQNKKLFLQAVNIENKRFLKMKKQKIFEEKGIISDFELSIKCIQKLLKLIVQSSIGNQELISSKVEQNLKNFQQTKIKNDGISTDKQMLKAVDTLIIIMRDHKIGNIKRKIQQQSKKFNDIRKQLFEGVFSCIVKSQVFEQSNLSQITQLSSKLLEEQSSSDKSITYLQKQKRVFQKMMNQSKIEQTKMAYKNLIDTSVYLVKLFKNLKQTHKQSNNQSNRLKSSSIIKKPITSKSFNSNSTNTKSNQKSSNKSKIKQLESSQSKVEESKMLQSKIQESKLSEGLSQSKIQQSLKNELSATVIHLNHMMNALQTDQVDITQKQSIMNRYQNEDIKRIIQVVYNAIDMSKKQSEDLKDFIETLSFDIQSLKSKQQILQQSLVSKEQKQQFFRSILSKISLQLFQSDNQSNYILILTQIKQKMRINFTQSLNKKQQAFQYQVLSKICSKFILTFNFPLTSIPPIPKDLLTFCPSISNIQKQISRIIDQNLNYKQLNYELQNKYQLDLKYQMQSSQYEMENKCNEIIYLKNTIQNLSQQVLNLRKQISQFNRNNTEVDDLRLQINFLKSENNHNSIKFEQIIHNLQLQLHQFDDRNKQLSQKLKVTIIQSDKIIEKLKQQYLNEKYSLQLKHQETVQKYKEIRDKNTTLESDIFLYKREIESLKNQSNKGDNIEQQVVNSLREENALLRTDVIEKGKMIHEFQVQLSPRSMKSSVSGSFHNITEQDGFRKKNSSNFIQRVQPFNQSQNNREDDNKIQLQNQIKFLKQKIDILNLQRSRNNNIIDDLQKQLKFKVAEVNNKCYENQKLKRQVDQIKRVQIRLRQKLRDFEISQSSIVKSSTKWNQRDGYSDNSNYYTHNYTSNAQKQVKQSYEFVTKKFTSKPHKPSLPSSPKSNKMQNQMRQLQKQNESLISRIKLLSVFTIIDQQNKAFVHNTNKVINSLLEFLSTSQQFQQCDYSDVDYITTLSQYLSHQDYQGYFQTLQTFFKDLFLNVFQRKNNVLSKQADQLLFLKDRMQKLLSQKIDQIQQQQQKLSYAQRTPFKNYNQQKSPQIVPHLQHLFKVFMKYKDPKTLKEVCQILNVNEDKESY